MLDLLEGGSFTTANRRILPRCVTHCRMYSRCKVKLIWECGDGNFQLHQRNPRARMCNGVSPFVLASKGQQLREGTPIDSRLYPKISESGGSVAKNRTCLLSCRGNNISVKSQAKSYLSTFHGDMGKYSFSAPQCHGWKT